MRTLRPWLLVLTLTAAGAAAALGYGLTAPKQYRATSQLLVSPVSAADPTFAGLDVFRDVPGKASAAASAAVLVRSPQVADAVRAQLGIRRSRDSLLSDVHAHVVDGSSVVDVQVDDASPTSAAQLANAVVDGLIAQRTAGFQSQLTSVIRRDGELLGKGDPGPQATELARRLAVLRTFQGQPDPTLRRAATATAPSAASWPDLAALVPVGAGIGLAAGALCFLLLALTRLRRAGESPAYSRDMPDRAVEALVDRLEQRLAGRESALAARERDLQAKIDELRALEGRPLPDDADLRRREAELAERERALAERVAAVTQRELAAARAAASASRELDDTELSERERALEERIAAVTQRELAVARAAAAHARDEVELAERERQLETRWAERGPRAAAAAPRAPEPAPGRGQGEPPGLFNLGDLERLVAERGGAHPDRLDEWESYLQVLRDYAEPDGRLPGSFDWLVQDTFAPLLD